jgi:transcription-repair coupling factor (superfamily II helicase)
MSVMGFKDISIIESPPKDRQAINTCHIVFDPVTLKKAIELELERNGQIYFVNNHVSTIDTLARTIRDLAPNGTKISVAHGQMPENELESVMLSFFKGKTDILVCTTIIENGMDVPNANTMFINEAHTFGLSQLYQLRGRIGRSDKPAYAYLITPGKQTLTEDARTRLEALQEFSHLGAGFRIAMLDLELRGAGDILGSKQSGHINEIGFELYSSLLEKTVKELKNEEIIEEETVLQMGKLGFIPQNYIENSSIRLSFVRKLNLTSSFKQLLNIKDELEDRFGTIPKQVSNLIEGHRLRLILREVGVQSVEFTKEKCVIYPCPKNKFNIESIVKAILVCNNIKLLPEGYILFNNTYDNLNDFIQFIIQFVTENSLIKK